MQTVEEGRENRDGKIKYDTTTTDKVWDRG